MPFLSYNTGCNALGAAPHWFPGPTFSLPPLGQLKSQIVPCKVQLVEAGVPEAALYSVCHH